MARPCIAFLTDFGTRDYYVGAMKGVALGICPEATLVDLTHEIPPQDVTAGALELAATCAYFPEGTIFVAVVDPGVGTDRRAIAAEAGGYRFVAPDNGLLTGVFRERPPDRVVALTEPRYARETTSRTFDGRDRFAPAAAWLATGVDLGALGPALDTWQTIAFPAPRVLPAGIEGEVTRIDRFGSLITNIDRATFDTVTRGRRVTITAGAARLSAVVGTYAAAGPSDVCALFGSTGHLEVAVNGGSAADRLGLTRGARVTISAE
jgi:S-adenosylmethionine hydrolase